jgi:RNA polymerase sigma-70 factor (ECF subfamily)
MNQEDIALFERYFLEFKDDVYRVAFYFTRNKDDAEDLAQDAFMRAYRFFYRFHRESNFKSWILRIMRNIHLTNIQKNKTTINADELIQSTALSSHDVENTILQNIQIKQIQKAIDKLPEDFKEVIILCDMENLPYEQIAEILQIPIGTVRSRLHRGRLLLKERLSTHE